MHSGDLVYDINNEYILKISNDKKRLLSEKNADEYLSGKIDACKNVVFFENENEAYYLKTKLKGENLVDKKLLQKPYLLMKLIKQAFDILHNIDSSDCILINPDSKGSTLVHGDFCLPNIITRDNAVVGFIDTANLGLGDELIDYEWCIWSFEYNLNSNKYTKELIELLGIEDVYNISGERKYVGKMREL